MDSEYICEVKKFLKTNYPRGRAIGVSDKVCFANVVVSDPEGRGIKPHID